MDSKFFKGNPFKIRVFFLFLVIIIMHHFIHCCNNAVFRVCWFLKIDENMHKIMHVFLLFKSEFQRATFLFKRDVKGLDFYINIISENLKITLLFQL